MNELVQLKKSLLKLKNIQIKQMNIECNHFKQDKNLTKSLQGKKIFKDQCVRCFHQPNDQHGLFVCMKCFNGFCPSHRDQHTEQHHHLLYTNILMTLKENQEQVQITKLAIGKEGGALGADEYDTAYSVYCSPCKSNIPQAFKALQPQVQSLINTDSPFKKQSIATWQVEILPCQHSLTLQQNPHNKDLSKCSDCELSTNLWLCLTCGNTGCGRKYFDGTGGNNHAIDHFQKTGHPLVVKLGTITAEGQASLYCYACNNDVKDEFLKSHMELLGIDFGSQKKTQKSIAEMNLDLNLNFTLSKQLQDQKSDKLMFGPDYTGMNNIGNSCYLNSVIQMFNSLPQIKDQYYFGGIQHTKNCKLIPAQCFYCQVAKIFIGLNSGKYSEKITRTRIINDKQVTETYQKAISPYDFKLLIADSNAEFRSARQQDAEEYLQFFLDRLNKEEPKFAKINTSSLFDYKLCNRLVCQSCHNFKLVNEKTNLWKFPVPPPNQSDIDAFNDFVENLQDLDMKKAKACEEPEYNVKLDECLNFLRAGDSVSVKCQNCNKNTEFISQNYFKTTPRYLMAMANRFILEKWVPRKLNALLQMPEKFDLSEFLFKNAKSVPGEQMKEDKKQQYSQDNLAMLKGMGYSNNASIRALKATKDNIEAAINWIMDNFDNNIDAPLEEQNSSNQSEPKVDEKSIFQIQEMGFDDLQARIALIQNKGSVPESIEWLFTFGGDVTQFMDCLQPQQAPGKEEEAGEGNDSPLYNLKAVIVHLGKSVHSGHYVVYVKKNGAWTLFNDEKVIVSQKTVLGKGYLFIYERD